MILKKFMGWLSLKIYKPNDSQEVNETYDFIDFLIDNDLPLEEKMLNLITSYDYILRCYYNKDRQKK